MALLLLLCHPKLGQFVGRVFDRAIPGWKSRCDMKASKFTDAQKVSAIKAGRSPAEYFAARQHNY
jgi:hypothetical protein